MAKQNGSVAAPAEKPKRKHIPSGIRSSINQAFEEWKSSVPSDLHKADVDLFKKQLLAYINGLLKQIPD